MLRLLIYLGVACTLILAGSVTFIYVQAASLARQQTEQQMRGLHAQAVQRMQQTLSELDRTVMSIASGYAVRRFAESGLSRDTPEDNMLRSELDSIIRQQVTQIPFIDEFCVMQDSTGLTVCNQADGDGSPLAAITLPALSRNERLLMTVPAVPGNDPGPVKELIYALPITERGANMVKGAITLSLNVPRMMKDSVSERMLTSLIVYDERGQLLYSYQAAGQPPIVWAGQDKDKDSFFTGERGRFVSRMRLDIPQTAWFSRAELEAPGLLSGHQSYLLLLLVFTLTLAAVTAASAFLYKRYYQAPVEQLRGLMKRAESGDLKAYWVSKSSSGLHELGESYNQMLNRLEELIKQVKREEALKKEAEMEALQYQLNPHFLYNTLNTIKWVAKLHKTPQISEAVTALVRLLQASLGKKGDFITIKEEITLLQDYMEIQRFRYGDKIRLQCVVEAGAHDCLLPCMLLQPLVENAIVHGIEPAKREGVIKVDVRLDASRGLLICEVEDNGIGMANVEQGSPDAELSAGNRIRERMSGIGLRHIREKIRLYYGSGYNMHIVSKPGEGTMIRLTLPMHQSGGYAR